MGEPPRYVSPRELKEAISEVKDEVEKLPTRWEVRFLIVAAIVVSPYLPAADIAKAVIP